METLRYLEQDTYAKNLIQTPRIIEEVLYIELLPEEPFIASMHDGSTIITKKLPPIQSFIFCPSESNILYANMSKPKFLPLKTYVKSGVKDCNIITPYKNAVIKTKSSDGKVLNEIMLKASVECSTENLIAEPTTEEFIAIIDFKSLDGILETTHIEMSPEDLQRMRAINVAKPIKYAVKLERPRTREPRKPIVNISSMVDKIFHRDPVIQVGNYTSKRCSNIEISHLTGGIKLYKLGEAELIPVENE